VDDAALVRGRQRVGDLRADGERAGDGERAAGDQLAHVLALDELHRDEVQPFEFVQAVDGADVRVVEGGGEAGLALEAPEVGLARRQLGREHFDDDRAAELLVNGLVNRPLSARAELFRDAVIKKGRADHEGTYGNLERRIAILV
jgi:hypothetical protein